MTTTAKTECPTCSWWQKLEAERTSIAYRTLYGKDDSKPKDDVQPIVVVAPQRRQNATGGEERDLVFFHAGRYAAGERDNNAMTGHRKLQRMIQERKNNERATK